MIDHGDRCITHLGDLDISFVLFIYFQNFLYMQSVTYYHPKGISI
jgi:hypothetical protein